MLKAQCQNGKAMEEKLEGSNSDAAKITLGALPNSRMTLPLLKLLEKPLPISRPLCQVQ